ncbi:hypothetical protein P691DRAFT_773973 [Macrolepiota fuliginosa MF-IS2]|uniref:DUF6533 domain-containing protein n=1 Tax=Macrolepiota fuliginosa MF-IS2 TaxID=1400762 RepID=A0A9P6C3P2_9AGAR|nr:hypothetical protein P691DRAFT_773973 [Macrolepiota fuliginosa MF-IS2]
MPPLRELMDALNHVVIGKWTDMATMVVTVYEWLITLDMEIRLIWRREWSFTKVMYLLNRYSVVVDFVLNCFRSYGEHVPACRPLFQATAVIYIIGLFLSEYTLAMRVCAVWKMNKIVIASLASVYVVSFAWTLTSFSIMLHSVEFFTFLPFGGCLSKIEGSTLWINYVILFIYDVAMLVLIAYPTIQGYRSIYEHTDLVKHIYIEGVLFYVYLLVVDIVCVTLQLALPDDIFLFGIPVRTLRSILAARALLHLRVYSRHNIQGVSTTHMGDSAAGISSIRFN